MSKAEQVKTELRRCGITMAAWARANGHTPQDVSDVLRGRSKGNFGESHAIAVKLGLKDGQIVDAAAVAGALRSATDSPT